MTLPLKVISPAEAPAEAPVETEVPAHTLNPLPAPTIISLWQHVSYSLKQIPQA